jgi:hypothetical protein
MIDANKNGKDDLQEIVDGVKQFVADVKSGNLNSVVADLKTGAAWAVDEFNNLCEEAQTFFGAIAAKVKAESSSLGEAVANALDLIYNEALHAASGLSDMASTQLKNLSSAAITAALGILNSAPAT